MVQQRVFSGRPFPGRQGRRTIGKEYRPQGSVLESQGDAGRILHREVPDLVAHHGIDLIDLTTDISEVVDLMDQIDQDRPSPLLLSPGQGTLKIGPWLHQRPRDIDTHQPAQLASGDDFTGLFNETAKPPLMPHQDVNLILSCCLYEAVSLGNALGNGLLDKKMKTLLGAGNADGRMEMVG